MKKTKNLVTLNLKNVDNRLSTHGFLISYNFSCIGKEILIDSPGLKKNQRTFKKYFTIRSIL